MSKQEDKLHTYVEQFESFHSATQEARLSSERDQDYENHHQWTGEEMEKLEARCQAPTVVNRIKGKVNLLAGILEKTKTKPKALPRTPDSVDGADAVTEALRFVVDNTDFQTKSSNIFREGELVWGYGGAIVEFEERGGEQWVQVNEIPPDRYYFDFHARKLDFSDKKYDGIMIWMDLEDAKGTWPDKVDEIDQVVNAGTGSETFDDKPIFWVSKDRNRIRVAQHFALEDGVWMMSFLTETLFLQDPAPSPFLDEFGEPQNPIECQTVYIDRDLVRYGEVRSYIWSQDEINHRRSRLLYRGSVKQTIGEKGAVDDVSVMKTQLAKADGHVEINPGRRFDIIDNAEVSQVDLLLFQQSMGEIDDVGPSESLAGKTSIDSGRGLQIQQQGGLSEKASLFKGHAAWEQRIYRQMWNRIKQGWTAEKWIRVTDDPRNLEWVGLNEPVTNGQKLQEVAQTEPEAAEMLQQMTLSGDPRLNEIHETRNRVSEMDVDIILTTTPDYVTIRQEQFEIMSQLAERYGAQEVPFTAILELSDLPNKDVVKKLLAPDPQQAQQAQERQEFMFNLEAESKQADTVAKKAKAQKDMTDAEAQNIENQVVASGFENIVADRDADTRGKELDNLHKELEAVKVVEEPTSSVNVSV
jgi:hypothetical protein